MAAVRRQHWHRLELYTLWVGWPGGLAEGEEKRERMEVTWRRFGVDHHWSPTPRIDVEVALVEDLWFNSVKSLQVNNYRKRDSCNEVGISYAEREHETVALNCSGMQAMTILDEFLALVLHFNNCSSRTTACRLGGFIYLVTHTRYGGFCYKLHINCLANTPNHHFSSFPKQLFHDSTFDCWSESETPWGTGR